MPARQQLGGGGEAYVLAWHWRDAGGRERQSHDRYCLGTDLVRVFARTDWSELQYLRARDIMTTRVISCGPEGTMRAAQDLMRANHSPHLPVVQDGRVMGMLSLRDTLALRLQESEDEMNLLRDAVVAARQY